MTDKGWVAGLAGLLVTGCLPIAPAHKTVSVPVLELQVDVAADSGITELEVIQPRRFFLAPETLIAVLKETPSADAERYLVEVPGEGRSRLEFASESRYVAVPAISLIPESSTYGQDRMLFLRTRPPDGRLYRIDIAGKRAIVEKTSFTAARQRIPAIAEEPRTRGATGPWPSAADNARSDFYRSVQWTRADRVVVEHFARGEARDVLSVRVSKVIHADEQTGL